jgi:hypothetical protein
VKGFEPITLDITHLRGELDEFEGFLSSADHLKERKQIAPFFKQKNHLVAALGYTHAGIAHPDRVSTELSLFGDFTCDAASGDSVSKAFLLVEFEDATEHSVLGSALPGKVKPWSLRFEHGTSQLVDWAWRLSCENHGSHAFRRIFGTNDPIIHFLLIAGRDADLNDDDQARIRWRANSMALGAYRISCLTFDGALNTLRRRLLLIDQQC